MTDQITPKIKNQTPLTGTFVDDENEIIDLKTLLTSGDMVVTPADAPEDDPSIVGTATTPKIANRQPFTGLFINYLNEIIDFKTLLTSGLIKVQLTGPVSLLADQTYLTADDNRDVLPNSIPLALQDTGFVGVENGTGLIRTRIFDGVYNQIVVTDGDGIDDNPTFGLSDSLIFPGTVTAHDTVTLNNNGSFNARFYCNILSTFQLGATFNNSINLNSSVAEISASTGYKVVLKNQTLSNPIELHSDMVEITGGIGRYNQSDNNITFSNAAQTFNIGGSSIMDISASGFRLGVGATINNIDNSGTSFLQTEGVTAYSVQQMISAAVDAGVSFRTTWDASGGTFPTTGGSGIAGAIEKGNWWYITVSGTLAGQDVNPGDWITALVNVPGQTGSNWLVSYQGVTNVFGRIGPIVATFGDYSFSLISGNIATSQLPNSGVNGNSQLVQLNSSGQLPAISGANLTGLTGSLSSSANNLNVSVNGGTASANVSIINTNVLGVNGTNISSTINGVASNNISIGFTNITGTAEATQGGTGQSSYVIGDLLQASSTSALSRLAAVAAGNVLLSGGVGALSTWGKVDLTAAVTGILPIANGGTGNSTNQSASVANAITFDNGGTGNASGTTYNGAATKTISYNTIGASPLAGSSSITTVGTIASGTWQGTAIAATSGGTGQTTTTVGDLLVGAGSNTWAKLAKANSSMLTTDGSGNPGWNAITQYNVLSAGASGAINNIAPSTAGYVLTSNGASAQPTFQAAPPATLTFNTVTGSTQAVVANNCYYSTYAGICVMTLPASATPGQEFEFMTDAAGHQIKLAQNSGQLIYFGAQNGVSQVTTTGTSGYLQTKTTSPNTVFKVRCIVTNTTFAVVYSNNEIDWV